MIMIGLYLLLGASTLFIVLVILELLVWFLKDRALNKAVRLIAASPNLNLVLYEIVAVLITVGLPLFIEESQHPFLIEVWPTMLQRMVIGILFMIGVPIINVVRYQRLGLDMRQAKRIYHVAASNAEYDDNLEVGLQEAVSFVNRMHAEFPAVTERGFLEYLSTRSDTLGEIARKKLSTTNGASI